MSIRTPSVEAPVSSLSGGNQQKVLLGRSMLARPTVLLADEPTRGVDVGARVEIYRILREAAADGRAVIVVLSSDAVELQGLSDRVLVFSRGTVVRELVGDDATEEAITAAALMATAAATTRGPGAAGSVTDRLGLRRLATGDYGPSAILAVLIVLLALYTGSANSRFLDRAQLPGDAAAGERPRVREHRAAGGAAGGWHRPVRGAAHRPRGHLPLDHRGAAARGPSRSSSAWSWRCVPGSSWASSTRFLVRAIHLAPVLATLATLIVLQGVVAAAPAQAGRAHRPGRSRTCSSPRSGHCRSRSRWPWSRRSSASGHSAGPAAAWPCGRSAPTRPGRTGSGSG